jgi:chemotaxis protein CheX
MNESARYTEIAARYGLEPVPDSVIRLTQLVAQQNAELDQVARVIEQDKALTARLLRAANPRDDDEADYGITTVDDALMRNGIGCVLLLAMGTPLTHALAKTFQTMLGSKLEILNPRTAKSLAGEHVLGTIDFSGKATGHVNLRLGPDGARTFAAGILGLTPEEMNDASEINDVIGELLNIIAGNLKSNLCDAGLNCTLSPPRVKRTSEFKTQSAPGAGVERMAFSVSNVPLFVDITVNPWND